MKTFWLWIGLALVVVGIDQYSKYVVMNTLAIDEQWPVFSLLSFMHVHNDGAAFSFLRGESGWQRWVFALLAIVFSGFLIFELRKLQLGRLNPSAKLGKDVIWLSFAFAMILGGANGNLVDRLVHGYVVDFIFVHWNEHPFPIFNLADSSIFLGAALWIAHIFFVGGRTSPDRMRSQENG